MESKNPQLARGIRSARLALGWTQEQAAEFVGVSRFQWIRWEQGLHMPSPENQEELFVMGVDPSMFEPYDEETVADLLRKLAARFEREPVA